MLFDMRHAEGNGDKVDSHETPLYFIENRTDIQGVLDPEALENRSYELISRHEALRIVIAEDGVSKPWQVILRHKAGDFRQIDLTHLAPEAQKERIAAECAASRCRPPALDGDPLLRAFLFRLGPADFHMALQWHHIVLDGWSLSLLSQELLAAELPLLPAPGFSRHIERLQRQDRERHLDWWRAALANVGAVRIALSGDAKTRENGQDESNELPPPYSLRLDRYVHDRLVRFARARGVTRNVVLMTVWGLLLSRYNDREDFVFATLSSGRSGEAETRMVGPCIGLLPMRLTCPHTVSFGELAATMQQRLL
jgi:hypothetical protein